MKAEVVHCVRIQINFRSPKDKSFAINLDESNLFPSVHDPWQAKYLLHAQPIAVSHFLFTCIHDAKLSFLDISISANM